MANGTTIEKDTPLAGELMPSAAGAMEKRPKRDQTELMFERLARDPNVDVEKLERLIGMRERIMAHEAKAAFDAAFAQMQSELPEITEHGKIKGKGGDVRSTYAKLEDIQAAIKPILQRFGFAIRHRTEWPEDRKGIIRIVGILSHTQGHSEQSTFEASSDKSDFRTDIQSMGSTVSYGRRYTTLDLLNITTRGLDNDGQAKPQKAVEAPAGYDDWFTDIAAVADDGFPAMQAAWNKSKPEYRSHATKHHAAALAELKAKAQKVKAS